MSLLKFRALVRPMSIRVAIIGASGYSGEELLRLLLRHPKLQLACVTSRQNAGKTLAQVFPKSSSYSDTQKLKFIEPNLSLVLKALGNPKSSIVFLALPHGVSSEWALPLWKRGFRTIDLSADFRLKNAATYLEFYGHSHPTPPLLKKSVYGLPEIYRRAIHRAKLVASPGCYPTSILLPLIPLLRDQLIQTDGIIANSMSGVSGAGRKTEEAYLFCECNESARAYGLPKHRHLSEIEQELTVAAKQKIVIQFTPHLIPTTRGILTTLYVKPKKGLRDVFAAIQRSYQKAYQKEPFVRLLSSNRLPDIKNVIGTNMIEIAHRVDPRTGGLILLSAEDNLTKGASGQAIQCMNIMCDFPETDGLL